MYLETRWFCSPAEQSGDDGEEIHKVCRSGVGLASHGLSYGYKRAVTVLKRGEDMSDRVLAAVTKKPRLRCARVSFVWIYFFFSLLL